MTSPSMPPTTVSLRDLQQEFTSITRGLRKDFDNLLHVLGTVHPSEQDRENAVMSAVQVLVAYDARVGQAVNKVKGMHARAQEVKGVDERIASRKKEYNQLLEELYTQLYSTCDQLEEQRRIVDKLDTLTGTAPVQSIHLEWPADDQLIALVNGVRFGGQG